jgi:hypothetical protein
MPQLDQFTYFTQFAWLFVCFMSFYVLLYNNGLPKVSRILKLRQLLKSQPSESLGTTPNGSTENNHKMIGSADTVIKDSLHNCVSFLNNSVSNASEWCAQMVKNKKLQSEPLNHFYIKSMGEISLAQMIKHSSLNRYTTATANRLGKDNATITRVIGITENKTNATSPLNRIYLLRMQQKMFKVLQRANTSTNTTSKKKKNSKCVNW